MKSTDIITVDQTLTIRRPDARVLLEEAQAVRDRADFLIVDDDQGLAIASEDLAALSKRAKEIEAARKLFVKPLDDCKKEIQAVFKPAQNLYDEAIRIIKRGVADYTVEQERKAAEARAKAEAEAAAERAALEAKAREAETKEEAEAIQEAAALVVAAVPEKAAKPKGVSTSKKWRGKVTDLAAFLRYAADHPEVQACVEVKAGALDRIIAATGGAVEIPGVEAYQETIIASRGK